MSYRKLVDVVLKNGKEARLALVRSPAGEWHGPLCEFLNSSPQPEGPPLHAFLLANEITGLDARYFIALHEGEIIGCVVTTDNASVGYINSTFVLRQERQLGTAAVLMAALEDDFRQRKGKVRFLTTRTGSPAERLFEKFGYRAVYDRDGRTGMERHYGGHSWDDYFSADPSELGVEDISWTHWVPHRALMWNAPAGIYRPLGGNFLARIREQARNGGGVWKGLATPDGRLFGDAVLRPHDAWTSPVSGEAYVQDLYAQPGFGIGAEALFDSVLPVSGMIQTFLDGSSEAAIDFYIGRGFSLETSLRDDFNHHDPNTRDIHVYSRTI